MDTCRGVNSFCPDLYPASVNLVLSSWLRLIHFLNCVLAAAGDDFGK